MMFASLLAAKRAWVVSRLRPRTLAVDRDQIVPLQFLRGLAASGVVIEHLLERYVRRGVIADSLPDFLSRFGQIGVATFFTISGFIMVFISLRSDRSHPNGAVFLRNRFFRIAPLYYVTTLAIIIFWTVTRQFSGAAHRLPNLMEITFSLLFIPHRGGNGVIQPIYELGWTLHYEMFFYLLFALGLMLWARRGALLVLGVLLLLVGIGPGIAAPAEAWGLGIIAYVFTRPIMAYFAIGIAIALIRQRVQNKLPVLPTPVIALLSLIALLIAAQSTEPVFTMSMVAAALAITVFTISRTTSTKSAFSYCCRAFGDASYSIYLTHSFLLGAFALVTASIAGRGSAALIAMGAMACLICFVFGWLTWRFIELPITDWLYRRRTKLELVAP